MGGRIRAAAESSANPGSAAPRQPKLANPATTDIVLNVSEDDTSISMKRRVIATVVVIIVVWMGARFAFKALKALREQSARTGAGAVLTMVRVETARVQDFKETVSGFGRAQALKQVDVVAEVMGVVREVAGLLEAGTAVTPSTGGGSNGGDGRLPVLVRLDDRDSQDRVARAEAEREAADADVQRLETLARTLAARLALANEDLATAERELRRIAGLVPKIEPQSSLDRQKLQVSLQRRQQLQLASSVEENVSALKAAQARAKAREREVLLARREVERAVIRAPFAGRIVARHVNVGARVRVGDPLFTIVDLSRLEVPLALPAGRYEEVHTGSPAVLRLADRPEALWEGQVARVAPAINPGERTFYAYVVLEGTPTESPAAPGTHLLASIDGRVHEKVIPVPRQAFLGQTVFVARPDGDADEAVIEARRPTVVRILSGVALVRGGLADGELILVTNLESVAHGSRVRIAPDVEETVAAPDATK